MIDLRTKTGREEEILDEIKEYGGLSVFWVTDNQTRAGAADRLIEQGIIRRVESDVPFPFSEYEIID